MTQDTNLIKVGQTRLEDAYKDVRLLGRGSFGAARLVTCRRTGKRLVSKEIKLDALSRAEREKARGEADLLRRCSSHPNIVTYEESFLQSLERAHNRGVGAASLYIVMEFCDGGDLDQMVKDKKKLGRAFSENEAMAIFVQLELALQHVHAHRILHRDIKAGNIFLTKAGVVKLGDFGIAKALGEDSIARTRIGTPYYLAPEICHGRAYGRKADVWSLGVVLYLMLALRLPYEAGSMAELVCKITDESRRPPALPERRYSHDVRALCRSLLRHDPDARPSADELTRSPLAQSHLSRLGRLIEAQRGAARRDRRDQHLSRSAQRRRRDGGPQGPPVPQSHPRPRPQQVPQQAPEQSPRELQRLARAEVDSAVERRRRRRHEQQRRLDERPPWRGCVDDEEEGGDEGEGKREPCARWQQPQPQPRHHTPLPSLHHREGSGALTRARPSSRPGVSALRPPQGRAAPSSSRPESGSGQDAINPFSREAMARGVDWASSRRPQSIERAARQGGSGGAAGSRSAASGTPHDPTRMLIQAPQQRQHGGHAAAATSERHQGSPLRRARHAQMVEEAREHSQRRERDEERRRDAARREYFETRAAARRNKLEVQRLEQSPEHKAGASEGEGGIVYEDRVRVNPRVHREWWGADGAAGGEHDDGAEMLPQQLQVRSALSKADAVRQRAAQRQAEAAERRREELRVACAAQRAQLRQVREQAARRAVDSPLRRRSSEQGTLGAEDDATGATAVAEPKQAGATAGAGLDAPTPHECAAKAAADHRGGGADENVSGNTAATAAAARTWQLHEDDKFGEGMAEPADCALEVSTHLEIDLGTRTHPGFAGAGDAGAADGGEHDELTELFALGKTIETALRTECATLEVDRPNRDAKV